MTDTERARRDEREQLFLHGLDADLDTDEEPEE